MLRRFCSRRGFPLGSGWLDWGSLTFLAIRLVVLIGLSVRLSCTYDDSYISGYKWLHKSKLTDS